jgi:hypothetical protein
MSRPIAWHSPKSTLSDRCSAENSNTSRHLAEFWMIEAEIAFADLSEVDPERATAGAMS